MLHDISLLGTLDFSFSPYTDYSMPLELSFDGEKEYVLSFWRDVTAHTKLLPCLSQTWAPAD